MSNKMALDALTAAKTQLEILLPDYGRVHDERLALIQIDAAIAALQAEPQGWRPIETAPKDGRSMLLGYPNRAGKWRTVRGQWFSDAEIAETWEEEGAEGWYETSVECEDLPNCWSIEPTHWMPLPATPPKD